MSTRPTLEELDHLQRSERNTATIPTLLAQWLSELLPPGANPSVTVDAGIEANGMSSETVMLTGHWTENGVAQEQQWVMRMQPRPADIPVFAEYHLDHQFEAMRLAAQLTDLPIPTTRWLEPTGDVLGSPFFLMDRVDGLVPPDVMPYTFGDNWFFDATADQRRSLQDATIGVVATLHSIPDAQYTFGFLDQRDDAVGQRHVVEVGGELVAVLVGPVEELERAADAFDPFRQRLARHQDEARPEDRPRGRAVRRFCCCTAGRIPFCGSKRCGTGWPGPASTDVFPPLPGGISRRPGHWRNTMRCARWLLRSPFQRTTTWRASPAISGSSAPPSASVSMMTGS